MNGDKDMKTLISIAMAALISLPALAGEDPKPLFEPNNGHTFSAGATKIVISETHTDPNTWMGPVVSFHPPIENILKIADANNNAIVMLKYDGTIIYGKNYRPNAAAKAFWKAMSAEYRDFLKWKSDHNKQ
jgi:hypothetical protein